MQLYYGSTSNFAFMQSIYRDLIASYSGQPRSLSSGGVEDGGAGLDMFQFRSIFFGISENGQDSLAHLDLSSLSPAFVSYSLARQLLQRFLETLYQLMPFQPPELFERQLDELFETPTYTPKGASGRHIVITAIALAALNTEHHRLADVLVTRVKSETANTGDLVNIETVQISLILISFPNSPFDKTVWLTAKERTFPERERSTKLCISRARNSCEEGSLRRISQGRSHPC